MRSAPSLLAIGKASRCVWKLGHGNWTSFSFGLKPFADQNSFFRLKIPTILPIISRHGVSKHHPQIDLAFIYLFNQDSLSFKLLVIGQQISKSSFEAVDKNICNFIYQYNLLINNCRDKETYKCFKQFTHLSQPKITSF